MNELGNTPADKNYQPSGISKAEERAWERFPEQMTPLVYQDVIEAFGGKTEVDFNLLPRSYFQLGYEQAEKDLALTWMDVADIVILADTIMDDHEEEWRKLGVEAYYTAVLKAYNDAKH